MKSKNPDLPNETKKSEYLIELELNRTQLDANNTSLMAQLNYNKGQLDFVANLIEKLSTPIMPKDAIVSGPPQMPPIPSSDIPTVPPAIKQT